MSKISNITESYYTENNIRYVFIDGNICDDIDLCYATLQQQLSLPAYFGKNLDALDEVLSDLDWIPEEKIKIILLNSTRLFQNEPEKKTAFLEILRSCDNEKMELIYLG